MASYGFKNDKTKSEQTIEDMINSAVQNAVTNLQGQINSMWNKIYPVGSIYYTTNSTNPSVLFGGTWEAYAIGRVLVGHNPNDTDFNGIGETGGLKTSSYTPSGTIGNHALTVNELPDHTHWERIKPRSITCGAGSDGGLFTEAGATTDYYTAGVRTSSGTLGNGHSHSFTGRAASITTIQPYQVVKIWRRTA